VKLKAIVDNKTCETTTGVIDINESIPSRSRPFGIYFSTTKSTYGPEDIERMFPTQRSLVLYGRTAEHLHKFVKHTVGRNTDYVINPITGDKRVLRVVEKNTTYKATYYWINHTGNLTNWYEVKKYYKEFNETL